MHLPLQKIHERKDAPSTKLANNTYGRVVWRDDPLDPDVYEAVIRYHDTDIIRCFYSVSLDGDTTTITPLSIFIDTGGWNTVTTTRRINQFCLDNNILATMHTVRGEVYWMKNEHFVQAIQDYWEDGLYKNIAEAKRHYNEFDNELNTGGMILW